MEHINRIEVQGRIGNLRLNEFNGSKVANFSLVTEYLYKSREMGAVNEVTWHNVVAWSRKGMPDFENIRKGVFLAVEGKIRYVKYTTSSGEERYMTEIVAQKIVIPLAE